MRRVTYIFLILVIAYLSALPLVIKASTSTMQVVGNLSLVKSEVPEEDEETPLEEQRTILKEEKLPPTGIKIQEYLFYIGILLILLAMLVKHKIRT